MLFFCNEEGYLRLDKYARSFHLFINSPFSFSRTGYVQERVNIGSAPPGSNVRWFRSSSDEPRFINTVTFDSKDNAPTLVMVHGYGASQGFFFRNFDALANRFRVIAIDQLG
jgi:abhydrolase domain-containing protein 5